MPVGACTRPILPYGLLGLRSVALEAAALRAGADGPVQGAAAPPLPPGLEPHGPAVVEGAGTRAAGDGDRVAGDGHRVVDRGGIGRHVDAAVRDVGRPL